MRRTCSILGILSVIVALGSFGCAGGGNSVRPDGGTPDGRTDGGRDGAPAGFAVASVLPAQGPVEGGTQVVVSGSGFLSGATVTIGGAPAGNVTFLSAFQLRVETPPAAGPGKVAVTVTNPDSQSATLPNAFEYRGTTPVGVDWCAIQYPSQTSAAPGTATEPIFGRVYEKGCSDGDKHCTPMKAQLGYGPPASDPSTSPSAYTWVDAAYNPAHTDDGNDEYSTTLTVGAAGTYGYAYRFSMDDGATWTYCDTGGSGDGFQTAQAGVLTVAASVKSIAWCGLKHPAATTTTPGTATEPIFGQVFVPGCSAGAAQCPGVKAELGYGPAGTDPVAAPAAFSWITAAYNDQHTGDDNDEYQATITEANAGSYGYLFRFSVDDGATWTYCDRDEGSTNGYQPDKAGALTVGAPKVDWCRLQYPQTARTAPGAESETIFGRAFVAGCTDGGNQCQGVKAQLGYGDPTKNASAEPAAFTWVEASYNPAHVDDNDDEYSATLTVAGAGTYGYAYRFSRDNGSTWVYCDWDGSGNGFDPAQMGTLTVAANTVTVGWCGLQAPASAQTTPGAASPLIFGRVWAAGCTDGASQCQAIKAQLGYGAPTGDPVTGPSAFTWIDAAYNAAHTGDDNDEYQAAITTSTAGSYAYLYRFSSDGGTSWIYCDLSGSTDGFQRDQMGVLTVGAKPIAWCQVWHPTSAATAPGTATETIYGQVYVAGCTEGAAQCAPMKAELGFGLQGVDPSTTPGGYTWVTASYNGAHTADSNDEYMAQLTPANGGSYGYAYRFSTDDGATWKYCDTNGADGFQAGQVAPLAVTIRTLDWCIVQWPQTLTIAHGTATGAIYGRVHAPGCSDGAAQCTGVRAQLGFGLQSVDPSTTPGGYAWVDAVYNASHTGDDNDEYTAALTPANAGTYGFVYRFSGDGGATWRYCDTVDHATFANASAGVLTVN
ncbi:MAG TPA: IPT/TIG domain-containing protein [Polyangia bacterium]|jgi:hypothetical protein